MHVGNKACHVQLEGVVLEFKGHTCIVEGAVENHAPSSKMCGGVQGVRRPVPVPRRPLRNTIAMVVRSEAYNSPSTSGDSAEDPMQPFSSGVMYKDEPREEAGKGLAHPVERQRPCHPWVLEYVVVECPRLRGGGHNPSFGGGRTSHCDRCRLHRCQGGAAQSRLRGGRGS